MLFEKLNTRCFNWEAGLLDALFLITENISSWRSPTPIMAHLAWFSCLTHSSPVLRVLEKRETRAVEAPARNSRARGLSRKTNQYGDRSGVRQTQTADLQTADLQTCRPADLQTCRLADLQTCRLADTFGIHGGTGGDDNCPRRD